MQFVVDILEPMQKATRYCLILWSNALLLSCAGVQKPSSSHKPQIAALLEQNTRIANPTHYDLTVKLDPADNALAATCETKLTLRGKESLKFYLNKVLTIDALEIDNQPVGHKSDATKEMDYTEGTIAWVVPNPLASKTEPVLNVRYHGRLQGNSAGVNQLSSSLVELASYSGWYPLFEGAHGFTSRIDVDIPAGYKVASRGVRGSMRDAGGRHQESCVDYFFILTKREGSFLTDQGVETTFLNHRDLLIGMLV